MALNPEGAYMSEVAEAGLKTAKTAEQANDAPDANMSEQYSRLRDRYARTTTALSSAAHDLKTPLSILNGYIELLRSEKLGDLNDRQREILRDMHSSGRRLENFIQDFLTFSVLETGELKMRFVESDMNELSLGSVPALVEPLSGKRARTLFSGEMKS